MLKEFLNLWPAIKSVINLSDSKVFKKNKNSLLLKDEDIIYLKKCLNIFSIFIRATTKLQAENYPTIYYLIPEVYNIYNRLEIIRNEYNVSKNAFIITYILKAYNRTPSLPKLLIKE
jgi:hypothetical protein